MTSRNSPENWNWLIIFAIFGVALPAIIYWLMFRHWTIESEGEETVAVILGFAGFGATIFITRF
jgi:hypothetical protein